MANIKLKNVFVCENVILSFNGQMSLINLISDISAKNFPAVHPKLTVVIGITGDSGIYDEKIEVVSAIDNKTIALVSGKAEINTVKGNNFIANFLNIVFPQEGKYWIKVSINKEIITNSNDHFIQLKKHD
jgi:hypothetical protein